MENHVELSSSQKSPIGPDFFGISQFFSLSNFPLYVRNGHYYQ